MVQVPFGSEGEIDEGRLPAKAAYGALATPPFTDRFETM